MASNTTYITFGFNPSDPTYFGTLGVNSKKEFFFHFLWNKTLLPSYYYDSESKIEKEIYNIDHISFHKDGHIHIRYFSAPKTEEKFPTLKLNNSLDNLPKGVFVPLLMYSIYNVENFIKFCGVKETVFDKNNNQKIDFDIKNYNSLSLILFLFSPDVNPLKILSDNYSLVFDEYATFVVQNIFGDETKITIENNILTEVKDLGLLVAITPKIPALPDFSLIMSSEKKTNTEKVQELVGLTILPSDKKILSLK